MTCCVFVSLLISAVHHSAFFFFFFVSNFSRFVPGEPDANVETGSQIHPEAKRNIASPGAQMECKWISALLACLLLSSVCRSTRADDEQLVDDQDQAETSETSRALFGGGQPSAAERIISWMDFSKPAISSGQVSHLLTMLTRPWPNRETRINTVQSAPKESGRFHQQENPSFSALVSPTFHHQIKSTNSPINIFQQSPIPSNPISPKKSIQFAPVHLCASIP
jgi:hypothetical protein